MCAFLVFFAAKGETFEGAGGTDEEAAKLVSFPSIFRKFQENCLKKVTFLKFRTTTTTTTSPRKTPAKRRRAKSARPSPAKRVAAAAAAKRRNARRMTATKIPRNLSRPPRKLPPNPRTSSRISRSEAASAKRRRKRRRPRSPRRRKPRKRRCLQWQKFAPNWT